MAKRNVKFSKPEEPSFIRKIKEKIGYQEGPTIETKKEQLSVDDDEENEDEKPVVVVLKPGDISEVELEEFKKVNKEGETKDITNSEKIVFRKPVKRGSESSHLVCSTKKIKDEPAKVSHTDKKIKQVKNSSLLSFSEEEEEF